MASHCPVFSSVLITGNVLIVCDMREGFYREYSRLLGFALQYTKKNPTLLCMVTVFFSPALERLSTHVVSVGVKQHMVLVPAPLDHHLQEEDNKEKKALNYTFTTVLLHPTAILTENAYITKQSNCSLCDMNSVPM